MEQNNKKACGLHCIHIRDLTVNLGGQSILRDINLHVHCGNLLAVIGKNGAGKTTLVRALLGEVSWDGSIEFKDLKNQEIQKLKIGYVPQHLQLDPSTPTSVYDLIAGFESRVPVFLMRSKKVADRVKAQLDIFGAGDLLDCQVSKLSGGQLQRVLLALATMNKPNLLILDEPVSGIDQSGIQLFYEQIDILKKEFDMAVILVSHDLEYVAKYADEVALLDHSVIKSGSVQEVYKSQEFRETFGQVFARGI